MGNQQNEFRRQMEIELGYLSRALHTSVGLDKLWRNKSSRKLIVFCWLFGCEGKNPGKAMLGELRMMKWRSGTLVEGGWKRVNQWSKWPNHDQLQNAQRLRNFTSPKRELLYLFLFIKCSHHIGFGTCWTNQGIPKPIKPWRKPSKKTKGKNQKCPHSLFNTQKCPQSL